MRGDGIDYRLDGIRGIKRVACVEEHDVVACSLLESFVHGIVESVVGLRLYDDLMTTSGLVLLSYPQGIVLRSPINDEMLDVGIGLAEHAVEGSL
jgi:hypothetical protein